jgi:hypothetical protein
MSNASGGNPVTVFVASNIIPICFSTTEMETKGMRFNQTKRNQQEGEKSFPSGWVKERNDEKRMVINPNPYSRPSIQCVRVPLGTAPGLLLSSRVEGMSPMTCCTTPVNAYQAKAPQKHKHARTQAHTHTQLIGDQNFRCVPF